MRDKKVKRIKMQIPVDQNYLMINQFRDITKEVFLKVKIVE